MRQTMTMFNTCHEGFIKVIQVFHHPTTYRRYRNQSTVRAIFYIFFLKKKTNCKREWTHFMNNRPHESITHIRGIRIEDGYSRFQSLNFKSISITIFVLSSSFFFSSYAGSRQSWFGDQEWGWSRKTGSKWHQQAWSCLEWHWMDDHDHQSYEGSVYQGPPERQPFQTLSTRIEIGPSIVVEFRRWPILTNTIESTENINQRRSKRGKNKVHLADSPCSSHPSIQYFVDYAS